MSLAIVECRGGRCVRMLANRKSCNLMHPMTTLGGSRAMLRTLALAALLLVSALPVAAGFKDGLASYQRGDYKTALREFKPLAEKGDAEAQFHLGHMYRKGLGVPKNYPLAASWFKKAAQQGNPKAQHSLALMYRSGRGVPRNHALAVDWYRKAAQHGLAKAQFRLGVMYRRGLGTPKDYALAARWYKKAAEQGYVYAQNNLGTLYVRGHGVPRDYTIAYMWYSLVTASGSKMAVKSLKNIEKQMTPAQIAKAQEMAAKWKPKKAKR